MSKIIDELIQWARDESIGFEDLEDIPDHKNISKQFTKTADALEVLQCAYSKLAQLFVLCDSSNPKKITLSTNLYNEAFELIQDYDETIDQISSTKEGT